MKKILFVLIILIAFNNLSAKWTKNQQDVFLEECLTDASNEYCKCGLEWIMKKVPSPGKVTFDNIKEMTEFCAHLYPDGWTKPIQEGIIKECTKDSSYNTCKCLLHWIMKKVPNPKNVTEKMRKRPKKHA